MSTVSGSEGSTPSQGVNDRDDYLLNLNKIYPSDLPNHSHIHGFGRLTEGAVLGVPERVYIPRGGVAGLLLGSPGLDFWSR